jgi:hypothetical protein
MTLRSPTAAMLWELWRLTRTEIAWKLALPIGGGLAAFALAAAFGPSGNPARYQDVNDLVAAFALTLIVIPHVMGWLSIAKLNGGQPGFPFSLAFTRPVRTAVIVGLPMAYLTAVSSAIYLVSATVLRVTSGDAFPLLPVTAWMAALTLIGLAASWSTRNRVLQLLVIMYAITKALGLAMERLTAVEIPNTFDWPPHLWPTLFDWPRTDYAWIALIGLASVGITVAMVARQRRGDALVTISWAPNHASRAESRDSVWGWLVSLLRLPCPTSSPTRAQLWYDLTANGLPVLAIGLVLAIVILLVAAVAGPVDAAINANPRVSCPIAECFYVRTVPVLFTPFSLFIVLFLGGNAFGIRRRQGRSFISLFEATQTYGTARVALLKLLVKSVCLLVALIAIAASAWISMSLLGDPVFVQMWGVPLSTQRVVLTDALAALAGYEQIALAFVALVGVVVWVALWAAFGALRNRYDRGVSIASALLVLYGLLLVWLAVGVRANPDTAAQFHLDVVYRTMQWSATAGIVITTVYVFWSGVAEHVLTVRYVSGAVAIAAAIGAAWLTVLDSAGVPLAGMSAMNTIPVVSPALLALMVSGLAPWSYSRIRHA